MKDPKDVAQKKLIKEEQKFQKGWYKHVKGGLYVAFALTIDEGTLEILVHYYSFNHQTRWTRTLSNFLQEIQYEGATVKRFTYQSRATKKELWEVIFGK